MARGRGGFTLVEVLASLALVAVILPVAMEGVSLAVGAAGLARDRIEAASLAETKLVPSGTGTRSITFAALSVPRFVNTRP